VRRAPTAPLLGEPRRLARGLPAGPLLRAYARATEAEGRAAPARRASRSRAAVLAAAFLGAWLVTRGPTPAPTGSPGSEGISGTRTGTGGVSG
jgi:hypothetical protein